MNENENKNTMAFPSEIYERAKAAKEIAMNFAAELKNSNNSTFSNPDNFEELEKAVETLGIDSRIVIGLGRFRWNKGSWDFDAPSTRAVMQRMTNLSKPDRPHGSPAKDYLELHIKYDMLSMEDRNGFRRHTVNHNIYSGAYIPDDEGVDDVE